MQVRGNTNLASLAMPNLSDLYGYIDVHNNAKLASLTMNNLFLVDGGIISVLDNPNLASLTMPSLGGGSWWNIIVDPKPATCNVGLYTC
ncbi:hypothetical protein EMIHUDRAFT_193867 [Emiliania huxleyi CCMP1516]|uniref:Receptor L-domain domain-containing protein n=2 Tax=Emiliania huxleyi TaxID=2903 RepID=A0A0D3L0J5_EMIH1|nr:hypothetical protein EMIHUDRAFT_193867 [Emiliania huxleyi CCMP1516]EOD41530.1 hypothetical protein EMIHUDRAFT_193867 [Emiliania huxleyi CCMP1516]|eukprot:XP_005793959.1 hypothetical protein EMIHUDRAFT_193867 [Emiliania huxleyi CCMP1516]